MVTTGKEAKQIPLTTSGGEAVLWQPTDAFTVAFEPNVCVQAECLQSARRKTCEPPPVCDPRSRLLSSRLRRLLCDHLGCAESQALRLAAVGGRGAQRLPTNPARP